MIKALFQLMPGRFMDLRMRASGIYQTRVIERPGLWMDQAAIDALSRDLRLVAETTLEAGSLDYGVFSADRSRLEQSIITVVYRRDNKQPIAFSALAIMDMMLGNKPFQILHLGLVMVDPNERSKGLSWVLYGLMCFLMFLRNQLRPVWISSVTQVPAVVGMVAKAFSGVYPGPHPESRRTLTHVLLARKVMAHHRHVFGVGSDAGFDEDLFVITNAYTGGSDNLKKTFKETAKHRDKSFNAYCQATLDYSRGDDVLQIGQMNFQAAKTYVTKTVPRGSLAAVAVTGVAAVLQRLVLPLWYWLDGSKAWGRLRPWH